MGLLSITFFTLIFISSSWAQTLTVESAIKDVDNHTVTHSTSAQMVKSSPDDPIETLLRVFVEQGSKQLFDGTFIYLIDGQIRTIKVLREVNDEGQIIEKFVPLDDSEEKNIRVLQNQYCLLDNGWQYQFHAMSSCFPFRVNNYFQQLQQNYEFSLSDASLSDKEEIVAGNRAIRLDIQSKDPYRYGYQLWFEPRTSTLLKYKLVNQNDKIIDQYLFTDITFAEQANNLKQQSQSGLPAHSKPCRQQFSGLSDAFKQYFVKQKLPDGYEAISFRKDFVNDSGRLARQFQLSDGLAAVSVFIEEINHSGKVIDGVFKLGPMSVAGKTTEHHQVTVLGAIPVASAIQILDAVSP